MLNNISDKMLVIFNHSFGTKRKNNVIRVNTETRLVNELDNIMFSILNVTLFLLALS